eukprot:TRINITY_DN5032_c0_g1_i1.p1 TRINITY_DN5032_c0_g1~~TRINITY_DN5032_c0_g1_i1.p1  ORF type:complete len:201 (+),score=35.85 TRINITY_DN5032_c0_g1_i1:65-604(+)
MADELSLMIERCGGRVEHRKQMTTEETEESNGHKQAKERYFSDKSTHIILSSQNSTFFLKAVREKKTPVTHHWVLDCVAYKRRFPISSKIFYVPLRKSALFIPDMVDLKISYGGFKGSQKEYVMDLIVLSGAEPCSYLSRHFSSCFLASNNVKCDRLVKAQEWGIPVVNLEWLEECVQQ